MSANTSTASAAPASGAADFDRVIRRKHGLVAIDFQELWRFRELFWLLSWRNVLIRYKQTYLGVAWAVLLKAVANANSTMAIDGFIVSSCAQGKQVAISG